MHCSHARPATASQLRPAARRTRHSPRRTPCGQSEPAFLDAALEGKLAEVQEHLRNGVNVHAKNTYGTALHRAADKGHMEVVTALLAAGADIHLQDKVRNCWLRRVRVRGRERGRGHVYADLYGSV